MMSDQLSAISFGSCKNTRNRNHRGTENTEFHREVYRWWPPVADFVCCLVRESRSSKAGFLRPSLSNHQPAPRAAGLVLAEFVGVFAHVDEVHGRKGRSFIGNIFLRNGRPFRRTRLGGWANFERLGSCLCAPLCTLSLCGEYCKSAFRRQMGPNSLGTGGDQPLPYEEKGRDCRSTLVGGACKHLRTTGSTQTSTVACAHRSFRRTPWL